MKKIICKIADLSLEKSIKIDIDQYEPESFKRIIASELNLTVDQFQIDNLPSKHKLLDKSKFYSINISINHLSQDIIFQFPNNEQITISIQYRTKIKDLASFYFQKEKIIYHENSIKFLKFILCGIEIPMDYRILCVPDGSVVYIKETGNLVTIKYRNFQFIFPENELIVNAYTLIEKNLNLKKNYNLLQIQSAEHKQLSLTEKMKKGQDYYLLTRNFFNVRNVLDRSSTTPYNLDPLTTVHELKSFLALIYQGKDQQLTPDNIIIFDQYKTKVNNPDTALLSIQDDEKMIYFDIDTSIKQNSSNIQAQEKDENKNQDEIPEKTHDYQNDYAPRWMINFEFEENSQFNFRQRISINTKMREISKMIAEKLHTEDEFKINYKEKGINHEFDDDTNIKDIREVIRQKGKDGLLRNYLYVKRQSQNKQKANEKMRPKSSIKPKIIEINDSDDVISSTSKSKLETSNNEKQINSSKPTKTKFISKDSPVKVEINDNNDRPSPSKQKQKPINDKDKKASKKEIDDNDDDISSPKTKTVTNQSKSGKSRKETKVDDDNSSPKKLKSSFVKESNKKDDSDNENNSNSKGKEKSHKYFYQIFTEGNIREIILESKAKVVDLKKIIAEKNNVDNIANIKILFAGKDLLNEIVLETLKIGSTVLYVYIRSTEDLLLMAAKALRF